MQEWMDRTQDEEHLQYLAWCMEDHRKYIGHTEQITTNSSHKFNVYSVMY